jgi:hypothetical protein
MPVFAALLLFLIIDPCNFIYPETAFLNTQNIGINTIEISDENVDDTKVVEIGYYEIYERLPKFRIDSVNERDFLKIPSRDAFYKTNIEGRGGNLVIRTSREKLEFKEYKNYGGETGWSGSEYLGYNSRMKIFAIRNNSTAEGLGFGEMMLIDSVTNDQYKLISLGDYSVSLPEPSVNYKYMVYYQNPEYESGTLSIAVLKIGQRHSGHFLKEYSSCFIEGELSIEEIRWKDDTTFYLKMYKSGWDADGSELRMYTYFVADLK